MEEQLRESRIRLRAKKIRKKWGCRR